MDKNLVAYIELAKEFNRHGYELYLVGGAKNIFAINNNTHDLINYVDKLIAA